MDSLIILSLLIWAPLLPLRILVHVGLPFWKRFGERSLWSFLLLWIGLAILIPVFGGFELTQFKFPPLPLGVPLGFLLAIIAICFELWTVKTLGLKTLFLKPEVAPEKNKVEMILSGPYRLVRHPFYFAEWLLLLGILFITSSWPLLVLLVLSLLTIPLVTIYEEKDLIERFGQEYRDYQNKVCRLVPFRKGC